MSATKRKNETELEELEDSEEEEVSTKKSSAKKATKSEKKAKTEELAWELGGKRKVTVSEFKGNLLVNIR